ncbi:MAG: cytosolic Fe-S cluster assembly factor cfd1 [Chaenotheca gracillima]|nr:MAG: cytosolic Fe-S cluster assembly factor cfd1 [Chaenotheca gracillima]
MADAPADRDALISQFCDLTGAAPHEAEQYLGTNRWDLSGAAAEYYTSQEEATNEAMGADEVDEQEDSSTPEANVPSGGGRSLGSGSAAAAPAPKASGSAGAPSSKSSGGVINKKFATLGDLSKDPGHAHGGGHGHDDDDDDDPDEKQDLFAGGEKSGLAVQDPGNPKTQVKDILNKARKNIPRPGGEPAESAPTHFRGTAQTLGGDEAPSRTIADPHSSAPRPTPPVTRILHFWRNGFSVEDGQLFRFDDPANGPVLNLIRSGRAPLDLMGVQPDQPVDVTVQQHEEDYVQPKKKYKPFSGGGQRLGSPTAGTLNIPVQTSSSAPAPSASPAASAPTSTVDVDESQPTLSLQIRLGDGSRLVSRFNTTHTIGDVYSYVNASSPASTDRPWVLMTTFPSKEMVDKELVLGDIAEFKRGGVVVQKWQ